MGMYDDIAKRIPRTGSSFIELKPGTEVRVRILDHPYISYKRFKETNSQTGVITLGPVNAQFYWLVWDYANSRVAILRGRASMFDQVAATIKNWNVQTMPMPCDITITTVMKGDYPTSTLQAAPHAGAMPPTNQLEMPDIERIVFGAIPFERYYQGEEPPVIGPDNQIVLGDGDTMQPSQQITSGPSAPVEAQILNAPQPSNDVVPTDADFNQAGTSPIDVSQILF